MARYQWIFIYWVINISLHCSYRLRFPVNQALNINKGNPVASKNNIYTTSFQTLLKFNFTYIQPTTAVATPISDYVMSIQGSSCFLCLIDIQVSLSLIYFVYFFWKKLRNPRQTKLLIETTGVTCVTVSMIPSPQLTWLACRSLGVLYFVYTYIDPNIWSQMNTENKHCQFQ